MASVSVGKAIVTVLGEERSSPRAENLSTRSTREKVSPLKVHLEVTRGTEVSKDSSLRSGIGVRKNVEASMVHITDDPSVRVVISVTQVVSLIRQDHFSFIPVGKGVSVRP